MALFKDMQNALMSNRPLMAALESLYERLPETLCKCDSPGSCCVFIPEMTVVEAMSWIDALNKKKRVDQIDILRNFIDFYLTNPVRRPGCPFLSDGRCSLYSHRTFACRAYGLWSQTMGRKRTKESREADLDRITGWQRFGIVLSPEDVLEEVDYCNKVEICGGRRPSDDELTAILTDIYRLGAPIAELQQRFERNFQSDFSLLVTATVFEPRKAVLGKYAVIKEHVKKGTDKRLKKMLARVSEERLRHTICSGIGEH